MRVCHSIPDIYPESGGTARAAIDMLDALGDVDGIEPVLLTQALTGRKVLGSSSANVRRFVAPTAVAAMAKAGWPLLRGLPTAADPRTTAVIHSHGLWLPALHWTAMFARKHGIPVIHQPHGMLEPWSLDQRAWKKRAALFAYQRRDLENAKAVVATSHFELENLRKLGLRCPIAVIPNGVNERARCQDSRRRRTSESRVALFLSRIHHKKGLLNLIRSWASARPAGWRLRIAGPDEGGHLKEVLSLAESLGVREQIEYVGSVDGTEKTTLYRSADLFVLPSFSENFGIVVAEALIHGVPVITTRGTPWVDLHQYRCGWWIDVGVDPLTEVLKAATALPDFELQEMGSRGREYARRYSWATVGSQVITIYQWARGQTSAPPFLHFGDRK